MEDADLLLVGCGRMGAALATGLLAARPGARIVAEVLAEPAIRARLEGMGAAPAPSTPEALAALTTADIAKWGAVVQAANLRPE